MRKLFGGSRSSSTSKTTPLFKGTGTTSIDDGIVNFDPEIARMRQFGLGQASLANTGFGDAFNQFSQTAQDLDRQIRGTDFIDFRINPVRRERDTAVAGTGMRLGRRGLGGSSFFDQATQATATPFNQRIDELRGAGQVEQIGLRNQLNSMLLEAANMRRQGLFAEAELAENAAANLSAQEQAVVTATNQQRSESSRTRPNIVGTLLGGGGLSAAARTKMGDFA